MRPSILHAVLALAAANVLATSAQAQQRPPVPMHAVQVARPTPAVLLSQLRRMPNGAALATRIVSTPSGSSAANDGPLVLDFTRAMFAGENGSVHVESVLAGLDVASRTGSSGTLPPNTVYFESNQPREYVSVWVRPRAPVASPEWVLVSVQVANSSSPAVTLTPTSADVAQVPPMVCSKAVLLATRDAQGTYTCVVPVLVPTEGAMVDIHSAAPDQLVIASISVSTM